MCFVSICQTSAKLVFHLICWCLEEEWWDMVKGYGEVEDCG